MRIALLALAVTACGSNGDQPTVVDAPFPDAPSVVDATSPPGDGGGSAYRHTIQIDGTNDFTAGESFQTTSSPSFTAYVTWDDTNVYFGYDGPDLSTTTADASTKWLFVYIDVDPGASTGAATSQLYNTQEATFPTGFGAELYLRFKSDGTFKSLEQYTDSAWSTLDAAPVSANQGTYTEAELSRSHLSGETVGIMTYMIDEKDLGESTFAGLYAGNFTDGYGSDVQLAHYLKIDFTSASNPDDPSYEAPQNTGSDASGLRGTSL